MDDSYAVPLVGNDKGYVENLPHRRPAVKNKIAGFHVAYSDLFALLFLHLRTWRKLDIKMLHYVGSKTGTVETGFGRFSGVFVFDTLELIGKINDLRTEPVFLTA